MNKGQEMTFPNLSLAILLFAIHTATSAACLNQRVSLQVLGSGGPELDDGRNSAGYVIWVNGKARLVVDAGSGTSVAFGNTKADFADIQAILLTHLHVDHAQDLPAFIKGSFFTARDENLLVLGPDGNQRMPATTQYIERLFGSKGAFPYLSDYVTRKQQNDYHIIAKNIPLAKEQIVTHAVSEDISVSATPVHHGPIAAIAWKVETMGCTLVFSGDTSNEYEVLPDFAKHADVFIANTAIPENAGVAARNLHMTPTEIAQIAQKAKVKKLVLSHFMNRSLSKQPFIYKTVTKLFSGPVVLAKDGMRVNL